MAIICITGVPGSGKSYYASTLIKKVYDAKNRPIFTNINLRVSYDEHLQPLDPKKLYDFAYSELKLFEYFKKLSRRYEDTHNDIPLLKEDAENQTFEDSKKEFDKDDVSRYIGNYDQYLKDSGLLKEYGGSYIVWDECQNDLQDEMGKADPVWIRFFSYHRHFDMDIVLITQDVSLIHRKYKPFVSKYYFGQNPSKRILSTTLRFKVYTDHRQYEKFYIETISVPMKKEIFDFYDSGEYKVEKSVLFKKLTLPVILIIVSFFAFKFLFSSPDQENTRQTVISSENNISQTNNVLPNQLDDENEDITFDSSLKPVAFYCNLDLCSMKGSSFIVPLDAFQNLTDAVGGKILYVSKISNYYSYVLAVFPSDFYESLQEYKFNSRSGKNEKSIANFSNGVFIPNSR